MGLSFCFLGRALGIGALATLVAACSGSHETAPVAKGSLPELDPLAPDASVVCGIITDGAGEPEPELYMLAPMNRKLSHYPDFAASVPVPVVKDCEGARQYMSAYYQYTLEHPGFDLDEELGPIISDDGSDPPERVLGSRESQKIYAGVPARNDPVVRLAFVGTSLGTCTTDCPQWSLFRNKTDFCTGTFIAKNWILTSAHCVTITAVQDCVARDIPLAECRPKWGSWGVWNVESTRGLQGLPFDNEVLLRAYVHPQWSGRTLDENQAFCPSNTTVCNTVRAIAARHDLALLYVPYQYDGLMLPSLEDNGAKRLSITPLEPGWKHVAYGWEDASATPPLLERTANDFSLRLDDDDRIIVGKNSKTSDSGLCRGDSGGPLMRKEADMVMDNGMTKKVEAIAGVLSSGYSSCTAPASLDNVDWTWTSVAFPKNREFIETAQSRWPFTGSVRCTPRKVTGDAATASVEECWGKPCRTQTDCPTDYTCWRPGEGITRAGGFLCEACGTLGDCSCIVGQCLSTK